MIFMPSNSGAALYQKFDLTKDGPPRPVTEGAPLYLGGMFAGQKQLDWHRAYFGWRIQAADGAIIVIYNEIPGGTSQFGPYGFYNNLTNEQISHLFDEPKTATAGILMLPGDGYLAVDAFDPYPVVCPPGSSCYVP
jgi:hypothetical protein